MPDWGGKGDRFKPLTATLKCHFKTICDEYNENNENSYARYNEDDIIGKLVKLEISAWLNGFTAALFQLSYFRDYTNHIIIHCSIWQ